MNSDGISNMQDFICIDPTTGRWIDEFDVPYLLSILALEDKNLAEMPPVTHIDKQQRWELLVDRLKWGSRQEFVANLWTEFAAHDREALATNGKEPQNP